MLTAINVGILQQVQHFVYFLKYCLNVLRFILNGTLLNELILQACVQKGSSRIQCFNDQASVYNTYSFIIYSFYCIIDWIAQKICLVQIIYLLFIYITQLA